VREGTLRRMVDEPLAVPDASAGHLDGCVRCQVRHERVVEDAAATRRLLVRPRPVPDVDRAWDHLVERIQQAELAGHPAGEKVARAAHGRRRRWRVMGATVSGGAAVAVAGVVVVGAAAAATLTTVFAPTHVVPVPVGQGDLRAFTAALGLDGLGFHHGSSPAGAGPSNGGTSASGGTSATGGTSASGTRSWTYGTIQWGTPPQPLRTDSLGAAEAAAGFDLSLPGTLPSGVSGPPQFMVERAATLSVTFGANAGAALDGSTLTVTAGPAVMARYGGTGSLGDLPTLAVLTMERPTATSTGATVGELESFVLSQPGVPKDLAQDIRALGDLQTALPVPIPPGASETSVTIAGSPGVLLTEAGGVASGAIWEDHHGVVRTVAGLLDQEDVLGVARQLG